MTHSVLDVLVNSGMDTHRPLSSVISGMIAAVSVL